MDNSTETESNDTSMSKKKKLLLFEKCTPLDDVTPWCYTRVDENGTYILGSIRNNIANRATAHSSPQGSGATAPRTARERSLTTSLNTTSPSTQTSGPPGSMTSQPGGRVMMIMRICIYKELAPNFII